MPVDRNRPLRKALVGVLIGALALTGAGALALSNPQAANAADLTMDPIDGAFLTSSGLISGTADVGDVVTVTSTDPNAVGCTDTADAAGIWSCTVTGMTTGDTWEMDATRPDLGGGANLASRFYASFLPPIITDPDLGGALVNDDGHPNVAGQALRNNFASATIHYVGGAIDQTCTGITVDYYEGTFAASPTATGCDGGSLPDGTYAFDVTYDAYYNDILYTSNPTSFTLRVDTGAVQPTFSLPVGADAPFVSYASSVTKPAFAGYAENLAHVTIWYGKSSDEVWYAEPYCEITVDPFTTDGYWTCVPADDIAPLDVGDEYMFGSSQVDDLGHDSLDSPDGLRTYILYSVLPPPTPPTINYPEAAWSDLDAPSYLYGDAGDSYGDDGELSEDAPYTITAQFTNVDTNETTPCPDLTQSESGYFCYLYSIDIPPGTYNLEVFATDGFGTRSSVVTRPMTILPVLTLDYPNGDLVDTTSITATGTAGAGDVLDVTSNGTAVPGCTGMTVGASGEWQCIVAGLQNGTEYVITVTRPLDGASRTSYVDMLLPPTLTTPATDPFYTNDPMPHYSGPKPAGAELYHTVSLYAEGVDPFDYYSIPIDECYSGSDLLLSEWSCDFTEPLADGTYVVKVTRSMPCEGECFPPSTYLVGSLFVDTVAADPTITDPSGSPAETSDTRPSFSGVAESTIDGVSSAVTILYQATESGPYDTYCETTADGDGNYTCSDALFELVPGDTYRFRAIQTDGLGNVSPGTSTPLVLTILDAPESPTIDAPVDGFRTLNPELSVDGTRPELGSLHVTVDGNMIDGSPDDPCTLAVEGTNWSCYSSTWALGEHLVSAYMTDDYGTPSETVNSGFTIQGAIDITSPTDEQVLKTASTTITGTSDLPNSLVIAVDGTTVCPAAPVTAGAWSCAVNGLTTGQHTVTATRTIDATTVSTEFGVLLPPAVTTANPLLTNDPTPTYSGPKPAGFDGTYTVDFGGGVTCEDSTSEGTTWSCAPVTSLTDGTHAVSVTHTVDWFESSFTSDPTPGSVTLDSVALDPTITTPTGPAASTSVTRPGVAGLAEPGSAVTVFYASGGLAAEYCAVTAGGSGIYSCLMGTVPVLDPGKIYTFTTQQTDVFGNTSPGTTVRLTLSILFPPHVPTISSPADGTTTTDTATVITGPVPPTGTLHVIVDGEECELTIVGSTWTCDVTPLALGDHEVQAYVVDIYGTPSPTVTTEFTIIAPAPPPPAPSPSATPGPTATPTPTPTVAPTPTFTVKDKDGNDVTTKPILAGDEVIIEGKDGAPGAIAAAELHSRVVALGTATVRADGTFTIKATIPASVEPGNHKFIVTVTPVGQTPVVIERAATINSAPLKFVAPTEEQHVGGGSAAGGGTDDGGWDSPTSFTRTLKSAFEFSWAPAAFGLAGLLAAAFLLLVAFPAELLESTIRENYGRAFGWTAPIRRGISRIGAAIKAVPLHPVLGSMGIIALTALILGFADPDFSFNGSSVRLWIALVISIVILNIVVSSIVQSVAKRRFQVSSSLVPMPAALLLVVLSVLVSRLVGIQPGFLFRVVLGVSFAIELHKRQDGLLVLLGTALTIVLGVGAWLGYSAMLQSGVATSFWPMLLQEVLAATTVDALATLTVALLPLAFLDGAKLFAWNKLVWVGVYLLSIVALLVVILPLSDNWGDLTAPMLGWFVFFIGFAVLAVTVWLLFRFIPARKKQSP